MWSSIKGICNWDKQETKAYTTCWFVKSLQILCAVFLVHVLTGVWTLWQYHGSVHEVITNRTSEKAVYLLKKELKMQSIRVNELLHNSYELKIKNSLNLHYCTDIGKVTLVQICEWSKMNRWNSISWSLIIRTFISR